MPASCFRRTPPPRKDPPWITLVQAEPKKKPAPLPPSTPGPPSQANRQMENSGVEEVAQHSPAAGAGLEPKPYNPFEDEEEAEEPSPAAPSPAPSPAQAQPECTPKSLHPWYGITPTSSPKTKKRPAPRAPSASPLGECLPGQGRYGAGNHSRPATLPPTSQAGPAGVVIATSRVRRLRHREAW